MTGGGNLASAGSTTYAYNGLNQLTTVSGGWSASLAWDAAGRLDTVSGTGGSTRFLYDGAALVGEYSATGTLLRRYVHGPGVDEPLVWYEGAGTADRRFLMADERGSIASISDSGGASMAINRYDEYGIPQPGNAGRFQYTGQVWLAEAGLYHYKARMYSPTLGRFLQTDPIGYGDGLNWYNYAGSDPVNGSDPDGTVNQHDLGEVCTGTRLCNRDGSSPGWVVSSLGPSQGGVGGNRRIGGSLAVSCNNCGSPGQDGADQNGSIVTVSAPTYSYSYSPGAFFLIAAAGAPQSKTSVPCQRMNNAVTKARETLPSRVTSSTGGGAWNDIPTLKFYQSIYAADASDAHIANTILTYTGYPLAFANLSAPVGRAVGVGTVTLGQGLSAEESRKTDWVNGIQARIDQINAQQEGSCP